MLGGSFDVAALHRLAQNHGCAGGVLEEQIEPDQIQDVGLRHEQASVPRNRKRREGGLVLAGFRVEAG